MPIVGIMAQPSLHSIKHKANTALRFQGVPFDKTSDGVYYRLLNHPDIRSLLRLKVLTFNLNKVSQPHHFTHGLTGSDRYGIDEKRFDRLARLIRGSNADVVLLQEISDLDTFKGFWRKANLRKFYPNAVFYDPREMTNGSSKIRPLGLAILAREKVAISNPRMHESPMAPRPIGEVRLDPNPQQTVYLFNLHLRSNKSYDMGRPDVMTPVERRKEIMDVLRERIQEIRTRDPNALVIVGGDFNTADKKEIRSFFKRLHQTKLIQMLEFPKDTAQGGGMLDTLCSDAPVEKSEMLYNFEPPLPEAGYPSDHAPVTAIYRVGG